MQLTLSLEILTLAFIVLFLCDGSGKVALHHIACDNIIVVDNLYITLDNLSDLCKWILINNKM